MPMSFQNSWTNSLQPGEYDANQDEKETNIQEQEDQTHGEAQAQAHSNQRITMSMARSLGRDCQMKSLFVISLVLNCK